jgi:hypothetical protein
MAAEKPSSAPAEAAAAATTKKTATALTGTGIFYVDEKTVLTENGVKRTPFPCAGILQNGVFRKMTDKEVTHLKLLDELRNEARAAGSPISLRPDDEGHIVVFVNGSMSWQLPPGETYTPGTVTRLTDADLKLDPFVNDGKILATHDGKTQGFAVEMGKKGHVTAGRCGHKGEFRAHSGKYVYLIKYNYGYALGGGGTGFFVDGHFHPLE